MITTQNQYKLIPEELAGRLTETRDALEAIEGEIDAINS